MKHRNLEILKENHINVPPFVVIKDESELDMSFSEQKLFAVRSSFDVEDGDNKSFAGQFDTFLNISRNEIPLYVEKVRKSYQKLNITDSNSKIIIQEMIQSDFSGVVFTANPVGILNEIVIVSGKGLGCNIVDDKIETTTYYYNIDDKAYYYDNDSILSQDILDKLIDLSFQIKQIFHKEMDIEYAVKDSIIYILQARPITTLKYDNPIILDNSNIIESYPGVSLPLTQSFAKMIYADVFKSCIFNLSKKDNNLIKSMTDNLDNMVASVNGRIYYNINNWYLILKLLPFSKKLIKIWQEMLGVENTYVNDDKIKISFGTKLKILHSFLYYLRTTPKHMKLLNEKFEEEFKVYKEAAANQNDIAGLLDTFKSIEASISDEWYITLVNDMYTFINTGLLSKKDKEHLSSIKNLESMKPVAALNELIRAYHTEDVSFQSMFSEYIERYGDRSLGELKLETRTYRTNPELLMEYIKTHKETEINTSKNNVRTGRRLQKAKTGICNREISRLNRTRIFGLARTIFLKIGEILVNEHRLLQKEDVFYLFFDEINTKDSYIDLAAQRKLQYENNEKLPSYSRLVFANQIVEKQFKNAGVIKNNSNLFGIGSSMGVTSGEAVIIKDARDHVDVKDKIIVAESTDPGWVFLIKDAKGIIAERGSILSHTAIITRELNKPSIVNVKNATSILKNGDYIKLDAYSGTVSIEKGA